MGSSLTDVRGRAGRCSRQLGVSLLEVLLSVSIIGVAMGFLLKGISTDVRTQSRIHERARVQRLAESQLAKLRLGAGQSGGQESELEAKFPAPNECFRWHAKTVSPSGDGLFRLVQLSVTAETDGREPRMVYSIQTLFHAQ
jgi:type II secretory pathway pseudopilin PulG